MRNNQCTSTEAPDRQDGRALTPTPQQARVTNLIVNTVTKNMHAKSQREEEWRGHMNGDDIWAADVASMERQDQRAIAVLGPAGSGKTTAVECAVEACQGVGARTLIVAPTGKLAANFRAKYPALDVDTIHGAFMLYKPQHDTLELMWPFDLVIVEEVGQLSKWIFERIMTLWEAAERLPALVFLGDFFQLPGVEETSARDSVAWRRDVSVHSLHGMQRCKCQVLRKKLELLRTAKPSKRQLRFILRGHKAPRRSAAASQIFVRSDVPLQQDIDQIMVETPDTIFLTVTRVGAAKLNDMAVRCLFANHAAVADVPADPESNIANFAGSEMVTEVPLRLRIFVGMRMLLTKNLNKEAGYVNGMGCKVEGMLASGIVVVTDQGRRLVVYPWTSPERVVHYPIRVGYASTLHKMQGATLDHITLWLDVPNMPAAGYVALSRVRRDADWRFIGSCNTHHFTPGR